MLQTLKAQLRWEAAHEVPVMYWYYIGSGRPAVATNIGRQIIWAQLNNQGSRRPLG